MGFLWVNGFSFFHCVASPFHSFVTIYTYARIVRAASRKLVPRCSFFLDIWKANDRVCRHGLTFKLLQG